MENVVHEPQMASITGGPPVGDALRGDASRRERARGGNRSRRRAWGAALAVGLGVAAVGGAPTAAVAADNCPNAAVRAQQGVQHLPNCFAYERVTPNDKNGAEINPDSVVSEDGSIISYRSTVSMHATDASGLPILGVAERGADGWAMNNLTDSRLVGSIRLSSQSDNARWMARSGDYRSLLYNTLHPLDPGDLAGGAGLNSNDLYLNRPGQDPLWVSAPVSGSATGPMPAGAGPAAVRMSPDSSRIVFEIGRVMDPDVDATARTHLWLFREGQRLELVDRLPDGSVSTGTQALGSATSFADRRDAGDRRANVDGSVVVFSSSSLHGRVQLYARTGLGTSSPKTVLVSADAAGTPCPVTPTFGHITESGRYVRFTCAAALTPGAPPAGGAYVRDLQTGAVVYDAPMADRGDRPVSGHVTRTWTRPEGTFTVEFPGNAYRTDHATGVRECVSCPPGTTSGGANPGGENAHSQGTAGVTAKGLVSPDGEVVFLSSLQLVPEDTNSAPDVYMWKDGKHYLLTPGVSVNRSELGGMSLDGSTISISTSTALVPEDRDGGARDIYVLRKNGGVLSADSADSECVFGCQGPAAPMNPLVAPLSLSFPASGDVVAESVDPIGVSGSRSVRGTSLKVKVRTPGGGRVTVSGNGLRKASKSLKSARSVTVTVKLSARSTRLLRTRSSLKRRATVRFVPTEGKSQTKRVTVTFRKAKKQASKKKGSSRSVAAAASGKAAR